jgi:hypothetical protein
MNQRNIVTVAIACSLSLSDCVFFNFDRKVFLSRGKQRVRFFLTQTNMFSTHTHKQKVIKHSKFYPKFEDFFKIDSFSSLDESEFVLLSSFESLIIFFGIKKTILFFQ